MSQEKKKALGKGLEALLPRKPAVVGGAAPWPLPAAAAAAGSVLTSELEPNSHASNLMVTAANRQTFPALEECVSGDRRWSPEFLEQTNIRPGEIVVDIPLPLITRNPYQTRVTTAEDPSLEELAESIKAHGVMQPIVVRPAKQPGPQGELYELIAGERRWLASQRAGKTHVPAIVREAPDERVLVLTIIENLHRQDLNPMQHARALGRLAEEFRLTQEEVAARTGLSRPAVANYLRLMRLPEELQKAVADGRLGFGQAKVIMTLGNTPERDLLARKVIAGKLTVRETEALVQEYLRPKVENAPAAERKLDPNVRAAELELQRALGCRVEIRDRHGKGKIVIVYKSLEDFDRVLEALK